MFAKNAFHISLKPPYQQFPPGRQSSLIANQVMKAWYNFISKSQLDQNNLFFY
jgi:hypothetical protein